MRKNMYGSDINNVSIKIHNDFIRNKDSKFYFEPNDDGQLDFLIYVSLMNTVSIVNSFTIPINMFVEELGYKPNPRAGKINSKILESFNRLEKRGLLELKYNDSKIISGTIILPNIDNGYFLLKERNLKKIMDNQLEKLYGDDYSSKYNNKPKDFYIYSYISSYMGAHKTTEVDMEFYGCFLNLETICENCNVSEDYLRKILTYFELDKLIFTANLGNMKTKNGGVQRSTNYYTDSFENLNAAYIYAKAYADKEGFKYKKYHNRTDDILTEITDLLIKINNKLSSKKDGAVLAFKNHFGLMLRDTINSAEKMYPDISIEKISKYIMDKKYLESKFYDVETKNRNKYLLYIAEDRMSSVTLLNHIKNKTKAMAYMYGIR